MATLDQRGTPERCEPSTSDLSRQLARLDARLSRVERHMNLSPLLPEPVQASTPEDNIDYARDLPPEPPPVLNRQAGHPAQKVSSPPPVRIEPWRPAEMPAAGVKREVLQGMHTQPIPVRGSATAAAESRVGAAACADADGLYGTSEGWRFERLIGARFFAIGGALITVIGVGLFLKLAMDRGWLSVPPGARCLSAAGFGVALLILGDWLRRRISPHASVGLTSAGLATLYASVLAAHGLYHLIGAPISLALLAATSAVGVTAAARSGLTAVGVLSMIGAFISPLVIDSPHSPPIVLPAYLLALLGAGLVLSWLRPAVFRPLRSVAWWGTSLLGAAAVVRDMHQAPWIGLGFVACVWAALHAELVLGWRRLPEGVYASDRPAHAGRWRLFRPMLTSFSSTIWAALLGLLVVRFSTAGTLPADWFICAAGAVATLLASLVLIGHLRLLRDVPTTDGERLGAAMLLQSVALHISAVALGFSGTLETIAWLAMGTSATIAAGWMRAKPLFVYGIGVLLIATARLLLWDSWNVPGPVYTRLGLTFSVWTLLMLAGGAAWMICARVALNEGLKNGQHFALAAGGLCAAIGALLMFASVLSPDTELMPALLIVVALSVAIFELGKRYRLGWLSGLGAFALVPPVLAALLAQLDPQGARWPVHVLVHGQVPITSMSVVLVACAAACIGFGVRLRNPYAVLSSDMLRASGAAGATLLLLATVSHGAERSGLVLAWTILSLGLAAGNRLLPRMWLDVLALVGLFAAGVCWCTEFLGATPPNPEGGRMPFAHTGTLLGLGVVVAMMITGLLNRRSAHAGGSHGPMLTWATSTAGLLLFVVSSFEVARCAGLNMADATARKSAVSMWWGVYGAAMIGIGFTRRVAIVRHLGLALVSIAAGKAAILDMADAAPEWRVLSFLALGLLMIGIAVGYARVSKNFAGVARPT